MKPAMLFAVFSLWLSHAAADGIAPPPIDAKAYYLVDAASGAVLAESAPAEPLHPASLTKLMTAYLVFAELADAGLRLGDSALVSEKAWRAPGSRMFIEVGSEVTIDALLHGLIVQSGNDAAIALAEHLSGSEESFVQRMNETAVALGMSDTEFRNVTGLPAAGHVSTARDLSLLAHAIIDEFPERYALYSEREFTYNDIRQHNRNALLWRDESVDGLKTGYTSAAGYCLVSSAQRDGRRLIAVVLGSSSADQRTAGSKALLDYGFDAFETHRLFARGEAVAQARVFKGSLDTLSLGAAEDVYVTVPRGRYADLAAAMVMHEQPVAPVELHQRMGEIELRLGGERWSVLPLVALEPVGEGRLLTRVAHGIALIFE